MTDSGFLTSVTPTPLVVGNVSDTQTSINTFWSRTSEQMKQHQPDFKTQELPLARIKKIMKLDDDVKMISAEAPVLFSKAAEIFIRELSLRAWVHTEDNKRRTLQRNDIATAISKFDQFDFLIDIVPRDELKPPKRDETNNRQTSLGTDQVQYIFQLAQQQQQQQQQQQSTQATSTQQVQIINPGQVVQPAFQFQQTNNPQNQTPSSNTNAASSNGAQQPQIIQIVNNSNQSPQMQLQQTQQQQNQQQQQESSEVQTTSPESATTQVFQQVITPSGELQNIPLQLTQSQLQSIQLQMQGKQPGQPIVIQTTPVEAASASQSASSDQQAELGQPQQPLFQIQQVGGTGVQPVLIQSTDEALPVSSTD